MLPAARHVQISETNAAISTLVTTTLERLVLSVLIQSLIWEHPSAEIVSRAGHDMASRKKMGASITNEKEVLKILLKGTNDGYSFRPAAHKINFDIDGSWTGVTSAFGRGSHFVLCSFFSPRGGDRLPLLNSDRLFRFLSEIRCLIETIRYLAPQLRVFN